MAVAAESAEDGGGIGEVNTIVMIGELIHFFLHDLFMAMHVVYLDPS